LNGIIKKIRKWYYTNKIRKQCATFEEPLFVGYKSSVTKNTYLGSNINFNGMEIIGGGSVRIGSNFHSGRQCLMITQNHKYDGGNAIPYDTNDYITKEIIIEDNVWLGDRVIILGGVEIGEGSIVQAGSVVVDSLPAFSISGGHPARQFSSRDINHYNACKREGRFC